MAKLILMNWDKEKIFLKSRKIRGEDIYQVEANLKEKEIKFKSDKVHKAEATPQGIYYSCNHAIGVLTNQQLMKKTNWGGKKITCQICKKRYLYKR